MEIPDLRSKRADPLPAKTARDYLGLLVVGHMVNIRHITTDRYGRNVEYSLLMDQLSGSSL